jgi:DegV family protein with EDD domain
MFQELILICVVCIPVVGSIVLFFSFFSGGIMSKIAIITDSTAYLHAETVAQYGIHVLPLKVHWDGETYRDNVDLHPQEFYQRLVHAANLPTTSQPSAQEFLNLFEEIAPQAESVLAILISSGISGTVDSAMSAAQEFNRIPLMVIDSKLTSIGLALCVQRAAQLAESGATFEDVTQQVSRIAAGVRTFFVVDTLKYLHKGGRIGGASRYLGAVLKIKPILTLTVSGHIDGLEKVRTKKKALQQVINLAQKEAGDQPVVAGLAHANDPETASQFADLVRHSLNCKELHQYELSPVIGTHVGPGTLGLAFYIDPA